MFKPSRQEPFKARAVRRQGRGAPALELRALEPRVLLDAAAAGTAAQVVQQHPDAGPVPQPEGSNHDLMQALAHAGPAAPAAAEAPPPAVRPVEAGSPAEAPRTSPTEASGHVEAAPASAAAATAEPAPGSNAPAIDAAPAAASVYFIDSAVSDPQTLLASLPADAEVHTIDAGTDGVQAIAQALDGRTDIGAIHILSHGSEGELTLGSATLSAASMQGEHRDELEAIGRSLAADGDILIYGCDFSAGTAGLQATELLASITRADVATSIDDTGGTAAGGDWVLETHVGPVEAAAVNAPDWDHQMAFGPATVSLWATDSSSNGQDTGTLTQTPTGGASRTINTSLTSFDGSGNGGITRTSNWATLAGTNGAAALAANASATNNAATVDFAAPTGTVSSLGFTHSSGGLVTISSPTILLSFVDAGSSITFTDPGLTSITLLDQNGVNATVSGSTVNFAAGNNTAGASAALSVNGTFSGAIHFTTTGAAATDAVSMGLLVRDVEVASTNQVPAAQSTAEDASKVFSTASGNAIQVVDPDGLNPTVSVTLSATNGTISLSGIAGLTFAGGDGTGDATMGFSGTRNAVNTALNGLSFTPTQHFNGAAQIQIASNQSGQPVDTDTVAIAVTSVNDAPVNTLPARTTNEDTSLALTGLSVTDVDAGAGNITVRLSVTAGRLNAASGGGVIVAGDGSTSILLTGTVASINGYLASASAPIYTPAAGFNGAVTLTMLTNDGGNTGGAALTDTDTATIAVAAVNDRPQVALSPNLVANGSFESGGTGWSSNVGIETNTGPNFGVGAAPDGTRVVEVEGTTASAAPTYIEQTVSTVAGQTYTFSMQARSRGGYTLGDRGIVSVNGVEQMRIATDNTWQTFAVLFTATGSSTVIRITSDGSAARVAGSPIDATGPGDGVGLIVDDVRVHRLDFDTTYSEGGPSVAITSTDVRAFDIDSTNLSSAQVTITNGKRGDLLWFSSFLPAGIRAAWNPLTFTMTLTGNATPENYQAALQSLRFVAWTDSLDPETRVIDVTLSDGTLTSDSASAFVHIVPINDIPVVDLNSTESQAELVSNGSFGTDTTGWTISGTGTRVAGTGSFGWSATNTSGSLTQAGISGWDSGPAPSGAAQLAFDVFWQNPATDSAVPATLDVLVGGVLYARVTTGVNQSSIATVEYLNGASGSPSTISGSGGGRVSIDLPGTVPATGDLRFAYASPSGSQDSIQIDNVSALALIDHAAGNDHSTTYFQRGTPVSVADTDSEVRDRDNANMTSAAIVLTNAQAGDALNVGSLPAGITASVDNSVAGRITVTLAGVASKADYAAAIRAITFSSDAPTLPLVDRIVNVTVNDGLADSAVAECKIEVVEDIDGDGVTSTRDIDDDNDGMLDREESVLISTFLGNDDFVGPEFWNAATSTLTGGSFGSGSMAALLNGDDAATPNIRIDPTSASTGSASTALEPPVVITVRSPAGAGGLSVDRFYLANDVSGAGDGVKAATVTLFDVDGEVVGSESFDNLLNLANSTTHENHAFSRTYENVGSFSVTVTQVYTSGSQTNPQFQLREIGLGNSLGSSSFLSRDSDGDGKSDSRDADSDNDGITDNVEAQATGSYIAPSGQGAAMVDVDEDGLDDRYDGNTASVTSVTSGGLTGVDTDDDGIRDFVDTDSDNDGRPDVTERGDGQPTSATSTVDTDGDGLLDIFEAGSVNDGFDANDGNLVGANFNLADSDGDTAANGAGAAPPVTDLDYRDNVSRPLIDLNSQATADDTTRDNAVSAIGGHGAVAVATPQADANDLGDNDLSSLRITVTGAVDGPFEIVSIGGASFALNANSTQIVSVDGTSFSVAYTVVGGFIITRSVAGAMPQAAVDTLLRSVSYRNLLATATAGERKLDFTLADLSGATSPTAVATVTVLSDTPPVAGADSFSMAEDGAAIALDLLGNDSDANGDPLSVVSINGSVLTPGAAQAITVPNGTVNVAADGAISFTPTADFNGTSGFDYVVGDPSGLTASASVSIVVTPVVDIVADSLSTPEDTRLAFNVLAGTGGASADSFENADAHVTAVTQPPAGQGSVNFSADGSMVFMPAPNFNGTTGFSYTVTSGGATETANVTIVVTAVADEVSVGGLGDGAVAGTDGSVVESALPAGSNAGGAGLARTGGFTLGPAANLVSFTIGASAPITLAQLQASGATPISVAGSHGTLVIEGYDSTSGQVSYTYTLTSAANHGAGAVNDGFALSTTDIDGDTIASAGTLAIDIVDDSPLANADVDDTISTAGQPSSSASGNVFTGSGGSDPDTTDGVADAIGADGSVASGPLTGVAAGAGTPLGSNLGVALAGSFGQLTLSADGSYSYVPDFTNPDVIALPPGQSLTDSFTYRITDGDGDSSTATLSVNITGSAAIMDTDGGSVLESDLPSGSNAADTEDVFNGSFTVVTLEFPLVTLTVGITTFTAAELQSFSDASPSAPIAMDHGELQLTGYDIGTGAVGYRYTLNTAADHAGGPVIDSIALTMLDSGGNSTAAFPKALNIQIVDDAPLALEDTASVTEDDTPNPSAGTVLGNDTLGADGAGATGSVTGVAAGGSAATGNVGTALAGSYGSLTLQADGSYSYALDNANASVNALQAGESLTELFTYQLTDADGDTTSATLSIAIAGANDAPAAVDDSLSTSEDAPLTLDLLPNDTDVDGDTLSLQSINGVALTPGTAQTISVPSGTVDVAADGTISFTPTADFNGAVSFDYVVTDPSGASDTGTVAITVTPVNDAPVAVNDTATTAEDTPVTLDLVGNDTDVDGDPLSVTSINGVVLTPGTPQTIVVPHGTLGVAADGTISFTPAADFHGQASFAYVVADPAGAFDIGTLDITVTPVNDAPQAVDDSFTMAEGEVALPLDLLANDGDVDGDELRVSSINGVALTPGTAQAIALAEGTVDVTVDGSISFTPAPNFNGTVSFDYEMADPAGLVDTATVDISVTPVNVAPVAVDDAASVAEETLLPLSLLGNDTDADGDELRVLSIAGTFLTPGAAQTIAVSHGMVDVAADGAISFTPTADFNGTASFDYVVADPDGLNDTGTVNITVTPVNDAPVAVDDSYTVDEDGAALTLDLSANDTDVDGDELHVSSIDGEALTPGTPQVIALENGTVNVAADGAISFTPAPGFNGATGFDYGVVDPGGLSDTGTVAITVTPVNDPPVALDDFATTAEDTLVTLDLVGNDSDVDGDALSVSSINGVTLTPGTPQVIDVPNGTVDVGEDGAIRFRPGANFNGPTGFDYVVADADGLDDTGTVSITVTAANDAPVAVNDRFSMAEDGAALALDLLGNDSDVDGDALSVTSINAVRLTPGTAQAIAVAGGNVNVAADGAISFTAAPNFNGTASFDYVVVDTGALGSVATVNIVVTPVNDAPVAVGESFSMSEDGGALTLGLLANDTDVDADVLGVVSINGVALTGAAQSIAVDNGAVNVAADGSLTFTPTADFNGTVGFEYVVGDPAGLTAGASVSIEVTPVADIVADTLRTPEDTRLGFNVLSGANGASADSFESAGAKVTAVTEPPAGEGSVIFASDGSMLFTPAANFNGTTSFSYTVTSGGVTETASVTINVTAAADDVVVGGLGDGTVAGTDGSVNESALPAGSNAGGAGLAHTGSFTLGPSANLASFTIGASAPITLAQLQASGATPISVTGSHGTLVIQGYDSTTGQVSYTYTLSSAANHGAGAVADGFAIGTTDIDGDTTANAGTLAIDIVDDSPRVNADVDDTISNPGQPSSSASGNVFTGIGGSDPDATDGVADAIGADGSVAGGPLTGVAAGAGTPLGSNLGVALAGSFGQLTLSADGSYSYVPDFTHPDVIALLPGESLTDSFTYQITDGDGDSSTATLSVNITGAAAIVDTDGGSVLESDLPAGSDAAGAEDVFNGSFTVVTLDFPLVTLTVGSTTFTAAELQGFSPTSPSAPIAMDHGGLELTGYDIGTGAVGYRYTLNAAADHSGGAVIDSINLTMLDSAGNSTAAFPKALNIEIVDDAPQALDDTASVTEDGPPNPSAGTVLVNDTLGADGAATSGGVTGVAVGGSAATGNVGTPLPGSYGTLTLQADGTYSYTLDNSNASVNALQAGESLTELFTYQVTDGDGDTTSATLSITIAGANDAPVAAGDAFSTDENTALGGNVLLDNGAGIDSDPEGDGLAVTAVNGLAAPGTPVAGTVGGSFTINADGSMSFDPGAAFDQLAAGQSATTSVQYTLGDGQGGTAIATVTVTVNGANDAPVAVDDQATTLEDTPVTLSLAGNDTDVDGGALSVSSINGVALTPGTPQTIDVPDGTLDVAADGTISFTPDTNFNGPTGFDYVVGDPGGLNDTGTVSITVTPVNDAPVAADDSFSMAEDDSGLFLGLLPNDSDVDDAALSVSSINGVVLTPGVAQLIPVPNGTVSVAADGIMSFTPMPNFSGTASFAYVVTDPGGLTDTGTVNIEVTPTNDAPVAVNDSSSMAEDGGALALDLTANDSDLDSDALSVTSINGKDLVPGAAQSVEVPNGRVDVAADGNLTFTPTADFNGISSFDYVVRDAGGLAASAGVSIEVTPVLDIVPDVLNTPEDTPLGFNVLTGTNGASADSFENTGAQVTAVTQPPAGEGSVTFSSDGSMLFTPAANFNGTTSLSYTVTSGGVSETASVTINVTAAADDVSVGGLGDGAVAGTDGSVNESALPTASNAGGAGLAHTGSFTLGPAANLVSFTIGASEPITLARLQASGSIPISVAGSHGTLVIEGYDSTTGQVSYTYTLTSAANHGAGAVNDGFALATTDIDGDTIANAGTLAIDIVDDSPLANADIDDTISTAGQPSSTASGNVFTGSGGSDPDTTDGVADAIGADGSSAGGPLTGVAAGTDTPLGSNLGVALAGNFGQLTLSADGSYSYVPDFTNPDVIALPPGQSLTDSFTYQISDGDGDSASATLSVNITGAAAIVGTNGGSVRESDLASGSDPAGTEDVFNGSFAVVTPQFPLATLTVGGITFTADQLQSFSDESPSEPIAMDHGGLQLTGYDLASGAVGYRYTLNSAADHTGGAMIDSVNLSMVDSAGNSTVAFPKALNMVIVDDVPLALDDTASVTEDGSPNPSSGTVLGNDTLGADGAAASGGVTGVAVGGSAATGNVGTALAGSYGTITLQADGSYSYTLDNANPSVDALQAGESLTELFTYQVTDADGDTSSATLSIAIVGANDAPVAVDDSFSTGENTVLGGSVLVDNGAGIDSDPDGDPLIVTAVNGLATVGTPVAGSAGGSFTINADGSMSFDPGAAFDQLAAAESAITSVQYTLGDGQGGTAIASVTVTVNGTNDAPVAVDDLDTTLEGTPVTLDLLGNDTDADDDSLSLLSINGVTLTPGTAQVIPLASGSGTINVAADGSISFAPAPDFNGPVIFDYVMADSAGLGDTGTVNLFVVPVNDAPVAVDDTALTPEDTPVVLDLVGNDTDVDAGDVLDVASINGVPLTGAAQSIVVDNGAVDVAADGTISFRPTADFNGTVGFDYMAGDPGGLTAGASVSIEVTPVADIVADSLSTPEDTAVGFNVLNGANGASADSFENTGAQVTAVTQPPAGQGSVSFSADGSMVFTPAANFNGTTSFSYTVTSGGVTETASVTINVTAAADDVVVGGLGDGTVAGTDGSVNESALPAGSNAGGAGLAHTGSFTLGPSANLASFTIGASAPITLAQLQASGATPISVAGSHGTLVIEGYDSTTGQVSYTYTLSSAANHGAGAVADGLAIGTTDIDGDTTANAGTLAIDIVDDSPLANADIDDTISTAGQPSSTASGNVFTGSGGIDPNTTDGVADVIGADGSVTGGPVTGVAAGAATPLDSKLGVALAGSFGQLTLNGDGSYSYLPDFAHPDIVALLPGQSLTDSFTYQITDGDGDNASATLSVNITGAAAIVGADGGEALESDLASGSNPAGTGEVFDGSFVVVTPQFPLATLTVGSITFTAAELQGFSDESPSEPIAMDHGVLQLTGYNLATGVVGYRYTLNSAADHSGDAAIDSVNLSMVDSAGNNTAAFPKALNIGIVDDLPQAQEDTGSVTEDGTPDTTSGNVLGNDTLGADGAPPSGGLTGVAAGGSAEPGNVGTPLAGSYGTLTAQGDASGTYSYTLDNANASVNALQAGESLTDRFTYQVTDADGDASSAMLSITIHGANDAPVAADDSFSTTQSGLIGGQNIFANNGGGIDSDVDADPLIVTAVGGNAAAIGTPVAGSAGGSFTINADGSLSFDTQDDFIDLGSGQARVTTVTYTIGDGHGGSATATVSVTVTGEPDGPVIESPIPDATRADGTSLTLDVSAFFSDPDGDTLNFVITGLPAGLGYDPATGLISGTIDHNASQGGSAGAYAVTVTAFDGPDATGQSVSEEFTLTVTNPPPAAADDAVTTAEDAPVSFNVITGAGTTSAAAGVDTDPDGDTLAVVAASAGNGIVTLGADGGLDYAPNADFNGTDTIIYTLSDGNGGTSTANVAVSVTPVNDAPVSTVIENLTDSDGQAIAAQAFASYFSDIDGDTLSYGFSGLPPGLGFDPATGIVSGTIGSSASAGGAAGDGVYTVTAQASDGSLTTTQTFTWQIQNLVPSAVDDSSSVGEDDASVAGNVLENDIDPDGDGFGVSAVNGEPANLGAPVAGSGAGSFVIDADGSYSFVPGSDFQDLGSGETRSTQVVYTMQDDDGAEDTATLAVTVTGVNDAPISEPIPDHTRADGQSMASDPLSVAAHFQDVEGDSLGFSASGLPAGLGMDAAGNIVGTIASDASVGGPYSVVVTADDGQGGSVQRSFVFEVTNPAPSAVNDSASGEQDTPIESIDVLSNDSDPDGDTLTVDTSSPPQAGHGTVTVNADDTLRYEPDPGHNGADTIVYRITDGQGGFSTGTVVVAVTPINRAPVSSDTSASTSEDTAIAGILPAATDPDGDAVDYGSGGTPAAHGVVAINPDGGYAYTPDADYNGADSFSFVVTDGRGGSNEYIVGIVVTPVNDAPIAANDAFVTMANAAVTASVLADNGRGSDGDPDGDTVHVSVVGGSPSQVGVAVAGSDGGSFTILADGSLSFNPGSDFASLVAGQRAITRMTYVLSDAEGGSASATVEVTVVGVAPAGDVPPYAFTPINGSLISSAPVLGEPTSVGGAGAVLDAVSALGAPSHASMQSAEGVVLDLVQALDSRDLSLLQQDRSSDTVPDFVTSVNLAGGDATLVLYARGGEVTLFVEDEAVGGRDLIALVRVTLADGRPLPGWITVDGIGRISIDRSADSETVSLRIVIVRGSGQTSSFVVDVDLNASGLRLRTSVTGAAADFEPDTRPPLPFAIQLIHASRVHQPCDLGLMEALERATGAARARTLSVDAFGLGGS